LDEATAGSSSSTQAASVRHLQCNGRSFIRPAAACLPETTMSVSGTITSSNGTIANAAVTGEFIVYSTDLSSGYVNLTLPDGSRLGGSFSSGQLTDWQYSPNTGTAVSLELVRQ